MKQMEKQTRDLIYGDVVIGLNYEDKVLSIEDDGTGSVVRVNVFRQTIVTKGKRSELTASFQWWLAGRDSVQTVKGEG